LRSIKKEAVLKIIFHNNLLWEGFTKMYIIFKTASLKKMGINLKEFIVY